MVQTTAKRQQGNLIRIKDDFWNWINVAEGEEIIIQDDESKHGRFISFWKKEA